MLDFVLTFTIAQARNLAPSRGHLRRRGLEVALPAIDLALSVRCTSLSWSLVDAA
jgi:hypothetical protein